MQETTRVRALCCECGNLRTVSGRFASRFEPSDLNWCLDDGRDPRGWRMTRTLKCSACNAPTVHAWLRDDDEPQHRDHAEEKHWLTREQLISRSHGITTAVGLSDLTTDELRQLVALLTPAEARVADEIE